MIRKSTPIVGWKLIDIYPDIKQDFPVSVAPVNTIFNNSFAES